jgi:flagellar biosynthesis protein FliP
MNNCEQKISIIKNIRNEQGMLLKKVAKADLNLNKSVLQAIESGRKKVQLLNVHIVLPLFIIDQLKNCLYLLIIERELYKSKP